MRASLLCVSFVLAACLPDEGEGSESVGEASSDSGESGGSESSGSGGSESAGNESAGSESGISESTGSESGGSESASETIGETSSDPTASETIGETTGDPTTGETTGGDPFEFPPVECGAVTCEPGLLCVQQGAYCNDMGMFEHPEPVCTPAPEACLGLMFPSVLPCLGETLCEAPGWLDDVPSIVMGFVHCPALDADCG